jgi:hypothetical protein
VVGHLNFRQKCKRVTNFPFGLRFGLRNGLGIAEKWFTTKKKSQNFEKGLPKSVETVTKCNRLKIAGKKNFKKSKKGYKKCLTKRLGCGKI